MSFKDFLNRKVDVKEAAEEMSKAAGTKVWHNKWSDMYKLKPDPETRTAEAITRFLPAKNGESVPFVIRYNHMFKGDNDRWVVMDVCPSTWGGECPICAANSRLWNSGVESDKEISRKRKRRKE